MMSTAGESRIRPVGVPPRLDASAARLLTTNGVVVGGGFLVGPRQVMTCAHVVARALAIGEGEAPSPGDLVRLDFPLAASGVHVAGVVQGWRPIRPDGTGDVAVLTVVGDVPAGLIPVGLVESEDLWGHAFRLFGFPRGYDQGVWVAGVLRARQGTGWVQMEATDTGYAVEPGFSGAAVWDDDLAGVVGMAVAADARRDLRASYLLPTDTLAAAWPPVAERAVPPSPYRGLAPFRERDAAVFFGRVDLTDLLVRQAERRPLIAVVGPSGSGKSSVVFAGLLPRLVQRGWLTMTIRPSQGSSPLAALAAGLLPVLEPEQGETERLAALGRVTQALAEGRLPEVVDRIVTLAGRGRLVLVVDQFEELFAAEQAEADRFIDAVFAPRQLSRGASGPLGVVLTLRADFFGRALEHPTLATVLEGSVTAIGQMSRDQLREVVEKPLPHGIAYEPGLLERILDDVGTDPGSLPLLQFALTLLWEHQEHGRLTHQAYEQVGGVHGALVSYAESVYRDHLLPTEQEEARRLLVQLVRPSDVGEPVRRVARRPELNDARWQLGQRLATTRLLVTDRDPTGVESVELVHEALIARWSRLSKWVQDDYAFRSWQERVRHDAAEWERLGNDAGALLRGAPLNEAERWAADRPEDLSPPERIFIEASRALRDRSVRRLRTSVAVLSMLLVLTVTSGVVAWSLYRSDKAERRHAALSNLAERLARTEPEAAMLLAAAMYNLDDTMESRRLLTRLADERRHFDRVLRPKVGSLSALAFHPSDPNVVAAGGRTGVKLLRVDNEQVVYHLAAQDVTNLAFGPDGATLGLTQAFPDGSTTVTIWSPERNKQIRLFKVTGTTTIRGLSFTPDGHFLAACSSDSIAIKPIDVRRPAPPVAPVTEDSGYSGCSFGFLDSETLIYLDGRDVVVWNVPSGAAISRKALVMEDEYVRIGLAVAPDGRTVLVSDATGIHLWNRDTRAPVPGAPILPAEHAFSSDPGGNPPKFTADGRQVLLLNSDYVSSLVIDLKQGKVIARTDLDVAFGEVSEGGGAFALSPDGATILSVDRQLVGVTPVAALTPLSYTGGIMSMALQHESRLLSVLSEVGAAWVLDLESGEATEVVPAAIDRATAGDPNFPGVRQELSGNGETVAIVPPSEEAIHVSGLARAGEEPVVLPEIGPVSALALDYTGEYVAAATDKEVGLWNVSERKKTWRANWSGGSQSTLAVGPGGRHVAAVRNTTGEARLWETSRDRSQGEVLAADASDVAFSMGGLLAIAASKEVTVWDVSREPTQLGRIPDGTYDVAFGPDDILTLEKEFGGGVDVWDAGGRNSAEPVFLAELGVAWPHAFLPERRQIFSGRTGAFHAVGPEWALGHVCRLLHRNLHKSEWEQLTTDTRPEKSC
jgi:WD40 repeat protein